VVKESTSHGTEKSSHVSVSNRQDQRPKISHGEAGVKGERKRAKSQCSVDLGMKKPEDINTNNLSEEIERETQGDLGGTRINAQYLTFSSTGRRPCGFPKSIRPKKDERLKNREGVLGEG